MHLINDEDPLTVAANVTTIIANAMAIFGISGGIIGFLHERSQPQDEHEPGLLPHKQSEKSKTLSYGSLGAIIGAVIGILIAVMIATGQR